MGVRSSQLGTAATGAVGRRLHPRRWAGLTESAGCFQGTARTMSVWRATIQRATTTFDPSEFSSALQREGFTGTLKDPESEMGFLSSLIAAAITLGPSRRGPLILRWVLLVSL